MSNAAAIAAPTPNAAIDEQVKRAREAAHAWVTTSIDEKVRLLAALRDGYRDIAEASVNAACQAKGIPDGDPLRGEEWLAGPVITLRVLRLLEQSLQEIASQGVPRIDPGAIDTLPDGRLSVRVFPHNGLDAAFLPFHTAEIHLQAGITRDDLARHQASFYKKPHGGRVCAVLGAGNVNSIAPTDCLHKLFVEGTVCILKMNPVNEYVGPFIERAFRPLVERGVFSVVYGGVEEGVHLTQHPGVDEIHITGSDKTHDMLVWGPPGPERERRRRDNAPLLKKTISSELGNITPVLVLPGPYSASDLQFQGLSIAGMVTQNASFNCNAAKLLVTPGGDALREPLLNAIQQGLERVAPRKAWYPGAEERWKAFTQGREGLRLVGAAKPGYLPWALIPGVETSAKDDRIFHQEPWCAVLSESSLPAPSLSAYLDAAVEFLNEHVWGTLCVSLVVHPETLKDPASRELVERAIRNLRYGSVAVNAWPALNFGLGTPSWGGHPTATLADIQSGLGVVHNTLMLEGVEKAVVRAPLRPILKPLWWPGHRSLEELGKRLVEFEYAPSWLKMPALAAAGLRT